MSRRRWGREKRKKGDKKYKKISNAPPPFVPLLFSLSPPSLFLPAHTSNSSSRSPLNISPRCKKMVAMHPVAITGLVRMDWKLLAMLRGSTLSTSPPAIKCEWNKERREREEERGRGGVVRVKRIVAWEGQTCLFSDDRKVLHRTILTCNGYDGHRDTLDLRGLSQLCEEGCKLGTLPAVHGSQTLF